MPSARTRDRAREIVLRDDGGTTDLGYPRTVQLDEKTRAQSPSTITMSGRVYPARFAETFLEIDGAPHRRSSTRPTSQSALDGHRLAVENGDGGGAQLCGRRRPQTPAERHRY